MNQLMQVGNGIVFASESKLSKQQAAELREFWTEIFPTVPIVFVPECRIVVRDDGPILFQFTGEITPTVVAEFQRWWEEANHG